MIITHNLTSHIELFMSTVVLNSLLVGLVYADHCDNGRGNQKMEEDETCRVKDSSKALVLYNDDTVLPLHKHSRTFQYCSHTIVVKQEWKKLGVAAVVWDAAEVLSTFLEDNQHIVKDKNIIELGAGSGLAGIVATLLGGKVTITDRSEVLEYLQKTVKDNLPSDLLQHTRVLPLDWTNNLDLYDSIYDVILGADIVYIEEVFEDLLKTLIKLSDKQTVVYLSCRIRYSRDNYFLDRLQEHFSVDKILYNNEMDVILYKAKKK